MYDRILFPTDGSEAASSSFEYIVAVASTHEATLHILNVADTTAFSDTRHEDDVVDVLEREGTTLVREYADRARARGLSVVTDVHQGRPAETIVRYADEHGIDLITMPTHGRSGLQQHLLGSVTERVAKTASVPILTVTPSEGDNFVYPPRRHLLPTDGSKCATLALELATDIATTTDASLHLLTVVESASLGIDVRSAAVSARLEERATEILDTAAKTTGLDDVHQAIANGRPYREIRSYITDNDIDLVVLGTRGETNFSRYVLGSVSATLLRTSPVPILLVPESDDDTGEE